MKEIIEIALKAGEEILDVYNSDFQFENKADGTPLTEADRRANKVILEGLRKISDIPVISEEEEKPPYEKRKSWKKFWIIDPLDGTEEFTQRKDEFAVNIALVENNIPVAGVVYFPALDLLYYGSEKEGAFKIKSGKEEKIEPEEINPEKIRVVTSKSKYNQQTKDFIEKLKEKYKEVEVKKIGSPMKIIALIEGEADIYPRFAPQMEWDTAAPHAVLRAVGGEIYEGNQPLIYNKKDLKNNSIIAVRDKKVRY